MKLILEKIWIWKVTQAEYLIFIHNSFGYFYYVDLSFPVHSPACIGSNFELTGFFSIVLPSWYLFYYPWYVSTRCVPDKWYSPFSFISLRTTIFLYIMLYSRDSLWKWRFLYSTQRKGKVSWMKATEGSCRWLISPSVEGL